MQQSAVSSPSSGLKVFSACLLSYLLIVTPFVQVAAATRQRPVRSQASDAGGNGASEAAKANAANVFVSGPVPKPAPEPLFAPSIVATKDDGLAAATTVAPGGTITYTVNVQNNGATSPTDDATGVTFSDTIDGHTTLVAGSLVAAASDSYNTIGNVQISVPDGATDLLGNDFDPDTGNNSGMTVTAETKSSTNCTGGCSNNVTINADGSFTYNPPTGFSGTDTFTYTAHSGSNTATATVKIVVANEIWFINNNTGACTSNCDGRLSHPFTSLAAFNLANDGAAGHPGDNDWIFVFESTTAYTGPATLRTGQKFIGQDATASLISLTNFTQPSGTDPLPVMNSGNGTIVNITTSVASTNGINLLSGNLLRGFTVGNTTGAKISGSNFGTLTVGNNASPDVTLNGTGQALNLSTGTFAATSAFVSVATTSSGTQGISLAGIAGTVSFGSTSVSGATTQGILISTTTANINFGNTSVTGGTDGISFQNNSSGTRTIGTLNVSGGSGSAFLHGAGGGNVTVTGAAVLSSGNDTVNVQNAASGTVINFQSSVSATRTASGGNGVNWSGTNTGATLTFNSLTIDTNAGTGMNLAGGGTVNVTNATGTINATPEAAPAIVANGVALNANFSAINSSGGTNGVSLTGVTGTSNFGGGSLTGTALGATFLVSGGTATVTYSGGITQANNAAMVSISGGHNTGTITFQTGTLSATGGTGLQFDNADGVYNFNGTTTLNGGDAGIDILNSSGGNFTFGSNTTITSPTNAAFNVGSTPGNPIVTYSGSITQNNAQRVVNIDGTTGNTITFNTGTLTGGASSTGININNANGNVTFSNGMTLGTSGSRMTNQALTISGGTGTYSLGAVSIFTTGSAQGIVASNADGTINSGSGTVNANGATAVNIDGPAGLTTLGMILTTVAANGGASGIIVQDTNGSFNVAGTATGTDRCGGLVTVNAVGTPATITAPVTAECTGGTIQSTTAAGVVINNATNISLNRMRIQNPATDGININTINGFTLNKSFISDSSGVADDKGIDINFLGGTSVNGAINITNSYVGPTPHDNLGVSISSGTSTWNVTGTVFDDSQLNSGFNFEIRGTSTVSSFTMDGCVLQGQFADGMQMQPNGTAAATITVANIQNNTFQNNNLGLDLNHDGTSNVTYRVINNTFRTHESHAINFFSSAVQAPTTGGTLNGRFEGNVIGTAGTNFSGSHLGNGMRVNINGGADATVSIINNTIRQTPNGRGIEVISRNGTGGLDATLTGNNVDTNFFVTVENGGFSLASIFLQSNCVSVCNTLRSDVRNNTVPLVAATGDLLLGQLILIETGASTAQLVDTTAPISGTCATELAGTNTGSTAASAGCSLIAGPINTVAMLQPLKVNRDYELARLHSPGSNDDSTRSVSFPNTTDVASTATTVNPMVAFVEQVAIAAMQIPASVSSATLANYKRVSTAYEAASARLVTYANRLTTTPSRTAALTNSQNANAEKAQASNRDSIVRSHHARSSRAMTPVMSGETVNVNIGTLAAGNSVNITFQVTVNDPPNLTLLGPPRVSNQGTVTANGGISVQTDDPTVGGASDATVTLIDLFDTSTTLASDLNPSNFGDQVTFTATVNETPVQGTADPTGTVDFIDTSNGNAVICNDVAVSAGSAQCQTSSLTAGTHNIRADYSGDGNFDPSQSNVVAQVVNACTPNPIVTSTADSGAGTLRDALNNVCSGTTITFDLTGAGPHTITLLTELAVAKNVTIKNASGESITVSGNNASRVFNINSGKTAAIIGLTISGGSATDGGGIINDGALTVVNSTLSGNAASGDGGAIATTATGTSLTLINTTISGNSAAGSGGGVIVLGGTMTSINSTITNNVADSDNNNLGDGGGIRAQAGTTTLKNTIVAGNLNENGASDAADDISGIVDAASSFNLIGTGGSGGLTNGVNNNQVGVASPGLGALANNGGTTQTHALLSTSVAVETGSNANLPVDTFDLDGDANTAETLPVDQRGAGFPRSADSADANTTQTVDIGAFELHPTIEDIANQTTAEDTPKLVVFNLGDDTGSLISTVTATSSNTALVASDGAHLSFSGSGGSRTLTITPNTNANSPADGGTTTITVTVTATNGRTAVDTFDVTVTEVNDNPVATDDTLTAVDEDSGTRVISFATLTGNDSPGPANESGQTLTVTNVSNPVGGTVAINGTNVEFTLAANFFGTASFDYTVTDNGTTNAVSDPKNDTGSASFTVNPINDPPSFTIAADPPASNEDGGPQTVLNFATNISQGPNETGQTLTFNITPNGSTGTLTFSSGPAIDTTTGTLTYTATGDTNGTATFNVTLSDNGSNTPPNSNTSAAQSFTITVNAQNDAPVVTTSAGNLSYTENDPATAIDTGLTVTDGDSPNLAGATVAITSGFVSAQDTLGFANQNGITGNYNSGTGVLTLTGSASVANYQTALRSVTYQNSSDNPTLSRTVSFTVNDGASDSNTATRGITITAVNDAPINTVPGPQSTNQNTPLTFSSGNGNQISVSDVDAGGSTIQVTLTAANGTLTLNGTSGLSFSFSDGNGTGAGDGTADATMTFRGTITNINNALNGMTFTPTAGFSGAASVTITTNDLGNTGSGGPQTDTDVVNIQVSNNISIQDAQVVEPTSGSVNMIFTVTLSAPAPAGGTSVNFTTMDIPPPSLNHATAGQDYTATSGTVNFAAGEQIKTILVPVLADNKAESQEQFEVVLSNPVNGTIADGTAIGTILITNTAATIMISELRTSGPAGAGDDFVEIHNNSDAPVTVSSGDGSPGFGLFKMGATCSDTPVLIGTIPNGTVIPARGHYLFVGSAYSLANYGGTGAAAGDQTLSSDIENDRNVALFGTNSLVNIGSATLLDAVGFGSNTGGVCDLFREGPTLTPLSGSVLEYSYFRDECGKKGNPATFGPCPTGGFVKDSNNNSDDFIFADTNGTATPAGQRLGAPGPQNLSSPAMTLSVIALLLDATKGSTAAPNRVRDFTPVPPNGTNGTLSIRRRFVNNTGAPVTRLRFRIVDISALSLSGGVADLRALTSTSITVNGIADSATCFASNGSATTPCTVTVQGTTLETPPAQPLGGAINSTLSAGTITLATPLAPGASINLQLLLGVQQPGAFKFFFNVEALP